MNGPMMMVLSWIGTFWVLRIPSGEGTWPKLMLETLKYCGVYLLLFLVHVVLYVGVVQKWLTF